ncbi:MAG: PBP1A family penicillin-binding protein, partial [Hyphomicrobiaceae bacterium]
MPTERVAFCVQGPAQVLGIFRPRLRQEARAAPSRPPARPKRFLKRLFRFLPWEIRLAILAPIYLGIPALVGIACAFVYYTATIPNPKTLRQKDRPPVVRILDRDGALLTEHGGVEAFAPIDTLPQHLLDAVVATEDRRFYEQWGVDPSGLARASLANLRAGRFVQGGSTLTQQLAKNLFLTPERTLGRKLEELVLALWLEVRLGKRDILEIYLNRVYLGSGAYGVETASRRFFGKPASQLTLPESAMLAGLLKAPSKFSPAANPTVARARARGVLGKMAEVGMLTVEEEEQAASVPIAFADTLHQREDSGVEYAVDAVLERLPWLVGPEARELIVETTIDGRLQRRAQGIVRDLLSSEGRSVDASQAGMAVLDLEGGMRVLVGGRSYFESQFNRAIRAKRQPGSAFKPFVYLAALEGGMRPDSTVQDLPLLGTGWSPRNEGGQYRGTVSLRDALALSMNAAAARLSMKVGPRKTAALARRLGIQSDLRTDATIALGTSEVTLLELTSAYGVFANGGRSVAPYIVNRVRMGSGEVIYERPETTTKVLLAPAQVGAINDMLNAALVTGTGKRAALPRHPAAGKTGTSQEFRDAWFVGYTAHLVAGVWVGNDDGRSMNRVMGGNFPARLWREVMLLAHDGLPPRALPGTAPASPAVSGLIGAAAEPADASRPQVPRERDEPDLIARVIADDQNGKVEPRTPAPTWADATL